MMFRLGKADGNRGKGSSGDAVKADRHGWGLTTLTRQSWALSKKNWIIMRKHWFLNLVRCVILPIAYAAFFSQAQRFFTTHSVLGEGSPTSLPTVDADLLGRKLVWSPPPTALSSASQGDYVQKFMDSVIDKLQLSSSARSRIIKVKNDSEIVGLCPQNFALRSECFAAVVYTLRGDAGLTYVNVDNHNSDVEQRFLPLQWALDASFMDLKTGTLPARPVEWPYTIRTNADQAYQNRQMYLSGIQSLIVLALFLVMLGAPYQLAGGIAQERTALLTPILEAMGGFKLARALSWHLSVSLVYLPAWVITAVLWQRNVFTETSMAYFIFAIVLSGTSLCSFAMLVAAPFANRAPTLAAVSSVFLAIIFAVVALLTSGPGTQIIIGIILPPSLFTYILKAAASWQHDKGIVSYTKTGPDRSLPLAGLLAIAAFDTLLWPLMALLLEKWLYDAKPSTYTTAHDLPASVAVKVEGLCKTYRGKGLFRRKSVVAVDDLSIQIPAQRIFCLLGRNGSGKTTTLSILSRLTSATCGAVKFNARQRLGIGPQKNVLFDELTCRQHLEMWEAIKTRKGDDRSESVESLLARCDLANKIDDEAQNLSGGQKRKLQLAIAIVGGSNLLLLDEISSGLDSLARRAIWRVLLSFRKEKTIVMTTHFLDESDFLGDEVAIIKAPGHLVALDAPQNLKASFSDQEYEIRLSFVENDDPGAAAEALEREIRTVIASAHLTTSAFNEYRIAGADTQADVAAIAKYFEQTDRQDIDYEITSATLEDVFLKDVSEAADQPSVDDGSSQEPVGVMHDVKGKETDPDGDLCSLPYRPPELHTGRSTGPLRQSLTIFHKRLLIIRRAWVLPVLAILVAILPAVIPLSFLSGRDQTCAFNYDVTTTTPLTYPVSFFSGRKVLVAPPSGLSSISSIFNINASEVNNLEDWTNSLESEYKHLRYGGLSINTSSQPSSFAYEASPLENKGLSVLNLLSNALYNNIRSGTGVNVLASFSYLPAVDFSSIGQGIKWVAFYSLALAVWAGFFLLVPCLERAEKVQANQYSNGMRPAGLWLGHLLFELPGIVLVAVVLTALYASSIGYGQFNGLGFFWLCIVLYGIASCLFSYVFTLFVRSQLAAFALVAGYQVIVFLLYLAAYLLILTYDTTSQATYHLSVAHFTISIVSPVCSVVRAALVSINLFSLLCDGRGGPTTKSYGSIDLYGGPILYLIVWSLICFAILVYTDSGAPRPRLRSWRSRATAAAHGQPLEMVELEKKRVNSHSDPLRVLNLRKTFGRNVAVDDITFGVKKGDVFALLGPNGAGKTTTLSCIRGDIVPDGGDVVLEGHSILRDRNRARARIGMCPQANPVDATLTVREHMRVYGRLKGLSHRELAQDIATLLESSGLSVYADRPAKSLSGGNQRKLFLALSLIGGPRIVLVDEYSSGVDPSSRRSNWEVLKMMTRDKALIFTTHSMEEVQALASRAGIIAGQMLAVGSLSSLKNMFGTLYELHLDADRVDEAVGILREQGFRAAMSEDTASRIEVSLEGRTFADLFETVEKIKEELGIKGVALSKLGVEAIFMKVVRQHRVQEEGYAAAHVDDKKGPIWSRWRRHKRTTSENT